MAPHGFIFGGLKEFYVFLRKYHNSAIEILVWRETALQLIESIQFGASVFSRKEHALRKRAKRIVWHHGENVGRMGSNQDVGVDHERSIVCLGHVERLGLYSVRRQVRTLADDDAIRPDSPRIG